MTEKIKELDLIAASFKERYYRIWDLKIKLNKK